MDTILGFFKGLDTFQMILLGGGIFLLWPTIQKHLGGLISKFKSSAKKVTADDNSLTDLVSKWEALCEACHENELTEACGKLEEVFPMLIKVHKHD